MSPDLARAVRVKAFAKINLTLRILGRRADGYHDLRTTFQSLALHDSLVFRIARGPFRIECGDPACPVDRTNLVWGAAECMWRAAGRTGTPRDALVQIIKRIPVRAGLGGGSSDAAAALRALAVLWRVKVTGDLLGRMAATLGADVPFFVDGGTALGVERGDVLFPLIDQPDAWVVLALPRFGVSTREAYAWFDRDRPSRSARSGRGGRRASSPRSLVGTLPSVDLGNDLEAPVRRRHPAIGKLVQALRRHGASRAAMSGSGSAVFGLFAARQAAAAAAARLESRTCRTLITRTLSRRRYRSAVPASDLPPSRSIV